VVGLVGARVTVTLEIEAEIPDGAPAHVVRTVTENCSPPEVLQPGLRELISLPQTKTAPPPYRKPPDSFNRPPDGNFYAFRRKFSEGSPPFPRYFAVRRRQNFDGLYSFSDKPRPAARPCAKPKTPSLIIPPFSPPQNRGAKAAEL
jgi:hypothetical protein